VPLRCADPCAAQSGPRTRASKGTRWSGTLPAIPGARYSRWSACRETDKWPGSARVMSPCRAKLAATPPMVGWSGWRRTGHLPCRSGRGGDADFSADDAFVHASSRRRRSHEEGIFAHAMAKCPPPLGRYDKAGGLYVSIRTNPTMGGVAASFALQGDSPSPSRAHLSVSRAADHLEYRAPGIAGRVPDQRVPFEARVRGPDLCCARICAPKWHVSWITVSIRTNTWDSSPGCSGGAVAKREDQPAAHRTSTSASSCLAGRDRGACRRSAGPGQEAGAHRLLKILDKEKTAKFEARFLGLSRPMEGAICTALRHKNIVQTTNTV